MRAGTQPQKRECRYPARRARLICRYNEKNEKIGRVDDLIVAPDGSLSAAIIDVGGFLGMAAGVAWTRHSDNITSVYNIVGGRVFHSMLAAVARRQSNRNSAQFLLRTVLIGRATRDKARWWPRLRESLRRRGDARNK